MERNKKVKDMTADEKREYDRVRQREQRAAKKQGNNREYKRVPKAVREEQGIPEKPKYVRKTKVFRPIDIPMLRSQLTLKEGDTMSSINSYLNRVNIIYKNLFDTTLQTDNFNLLGRSEEIIAYLEDKYEIQADRETKETVRTYINSIIAILNRVGYQELARKYKNKADELNTLYNTQVKRNILTEKERENWMHWPDILKRVKAGLKRRDLTNTEKIILCLYAYLPAPRRIADYEHMIIVRDNTYKDTLSKYVVDAVKYKELNYMVVSGENFRQVGNRNNARALVFNKYKTQKSYGQIVIGDNAALASIPHEEKNFFNLPTGIGKFRSVIKPYLVGLEDGEFLLQQENGMPFTQSLLTKFVEQTFLKVTGKYLTCNLLRKIFVTEQIMNNPALDIAVRENISRYMGHSMHVQSTYNRVVDGMRITDLEIIRTSHFGLGLQIDKK
jgi:DNA-binding CsgD family transcriptional regulator